MTLCTTFPRGLSNRMQVPLSRPSITQADIAAVLEVLNRPSSALGPSLRLLSGRWPSIRDGRGGGRQQRHERPASLPGRPGGRAGRRGRHLAVQLRRFGQCGLYQGATPVFADIDPVTLNIDPNRSRPDHPTNAGDPPRRRLRPAGPDRGLSPRSPERHGLASIRDACEAIGAERNGRRIGVRASPRSSPSTRTSR